MSPRFQWISSNSSRKSLDVRSIFSDFAIRVEREELSDVVWRMTGMYVFRHLGQDNFRVVPKKNGIYRRIVLPIDTIII